ncbi:hypothetical protein GCM10022252_18540 [Streptosporangium oxazolinicum]|uniref:DAGKc domain-containing protein n=1 Tax=Streptosporangium oxazolinicum TaxID=909287 RepID=A0ABP8ANI1_9ACTN
MTCAAYPPRDDGGRALVPRADVLRVGLPSGAANRVARAVGVPGGRHLEGTPDGVTECVTDESRFDRAGERDATPRAPRLPLWQAVQVISAWSD